MAEDAGTGRLAPVRGGPMLALLTLIYMLNYVDRQILVILQEPIKAEFGLHDWQLGLLTGASLSLVYAVFGLPIARWLDRGHSRVALIATITVLWSVATALTGLTRSYAQLVAARIGVGMAEAGFVPAAHALLSDLYPAERRPLAVGIFGLGVPLGVMFGLSAGGMIAQYYDWRTALLIVGLPGVLVALLFRWLAVEPVRGGSGPQPAATAEAAPGLAAGLRLLARDRAVVHMVAGAAGLTFALSGIAVWLPSFLIRAHGFNLGQAGLAAGGLSGLAGLVGTYLGGWQASRVAGRGLGATLRWPILGALVAIPLFVAGFAVGDATASIGLLVPAMVLTNMWAAPSISLVQTRAPVRLRATASALYVLATSLIGVSLGSTFIGLLSDSLVSPQRAAPEALRIALIGGALLLVWGIVHMVLAARAAGARSQSSAILADAAAPAA